MKAADLGSVLFEHPDVSEVYVAAFSEMESENELCAFIVPASGAMTSEDAMKQYCCDRAPRLKKTITIFFLDYMPRNRAGTINRDRLRKLVQSRRAKEVA